MNGEILRDAARAFPHAPLPDTEEFYRSVIGECAEIYRGEPPWAYTKRPGLYGRGQRRLALLNCAKVLCDSFAALTFSGQADIICRSSIQKEYAERILQENGFWERMPAFFSRAYALGGGALKVFTENGKVCMEPADAEEFIPTGYGRGGIDECIFSGSYCRDGHSYRLMEKHSMKNGHAAVDRVLFLLKGGGYEKIPVGDVFNGLEEHSEYPFMDVPMFAVFRPAGDNNLSGSSLGLSCFANCTDTLKALDIAFDSFSREFILGRKRIIVPSSCIRTVVDPDTGNVCRYFDSDDEVYQALKCDEEKDLKITDNTCELRVSEHVEAINALLDILCFQTGLSSGTLSFTSSGGLKTAAEIRSLEQRTDMTMQLNRCLAAELIESTVKCIIRCGQMCGQLPAEDIDVRIAFSDGQTVDRNELIERNIRLTEAGLLSKRSAVMAVLDCSEAEAVAELERIEKERRSL